MTPIVYNYNENMSYRYFRSTYSLLCLWTKDIVVVQACFLATYCISFSQFIHHFQVYELAKLENLDKNRNFVMHCISYTASLIANRIGKGSSPSISASKKLKGKLLLKNRRRRKTSRSTNKRKIMKP